jgi:hypothetical protein
MLTTGANKSKVSETNASKQDRLIIIIFSQFYKDL